ncbi:triose-phosphate isomerase [Candidatus Uhrbacteria bacterium]|nr:triose-phosphate isomerase [Candidatus Uhrbacteria bacterium]
MQLSDAAARTLAEQLVAAGVSDGIEVVLCPSFTALPTVATVVHGTAIALGAQDCAGADRAALTGEVSAADLLVIGCQYVIVGHSERRQRLGETDDMVAEKLRMALHTGLHPILCVGETLEERTSGRLHAVLNRQLTHAIRSLELIGTQRLCIAYEPIWAIGTGHAATPEDAVQAHGYILEVARELLGEGGMQRLRVLYGGSVGAENIATFLTQPNVHGVLVGTASQSAEGLRRLIGAARANSLP